MEKERTIFDFFSGVLKIWAISVLCLCLFCKIFGQEAYNYSSIFQFEDKGLALETLLQFLLISVIINVLEVIFFSDRFIKNAGIALRFAGMFGTITVLCCLFAYLFRWFPVNQARPWIMFFVSFSVCTAISVFVSRWKEKTENRKMQEALDRLKGEE